MSVKEALLSRGKSACELCNSHDDLEVMNVLPYTDGKVEECVLVCVICRSQIENPSQLSADHWQCLNDSMWSQVPPVQVMAWRILTRLSTESWAQDLLDMLYLDDEVIAWARSSETTPDTAASPKHLDSNGALLETGDTVTLIKDLNVKGANFTAKRGTAVRNISLVPDNSAQIEGRISGQQIVILTEFVKKAT